MSFDGIGVTRECFGPLETAAQERVARVAVHYGLHVERDRVGNLVVSLPGADLEHAFPIGSAAGERYPAASMKLLETERAV